MKFFLDLTDKRLPFVKEYLQKNKKQVENFNKEDVSNINSEDVIIVSPAFKWSETLVNDLPSNITIFAGNIYEEFLKVINNKNIKYINFMAHEDFVLKNATLTAEGFLGDLILNTKSSMYNQQILILGSGRVAKAVGYLFYKLGLTFDFAMRNEKEYNHAKLFARKCILGDSYKNALKNYDVVINTIPAVIFNENDANKFKKDCYVFELASKQCLEGISTQNFNYVLCPALPSKYTPKTAADLMIEILNLYL